MSKVSYSSGDVARFCDVTSRTVIRWIESGKLKAFKLPGRGNNRIEEADLLSFFDANGIPTPKEFVKTEVERNSVIISDDPHFVRHAKRLVRDADFITFHCTSEMEAGITLAKANPQLVVLDTQVCKNDNSTIKACVSIMLNSLKDSAHLIICSESTAGLLKVIKRSQVHFLAKPIDLSKFANLLAKLNEDVC